MTKNILFIVSLFIMMYYSIDAKEKLPSFSEVNIGYTVPFQISPIDLLYDQVYYPIYTFADILYIPTTYIELFEMAATEKSSFRFQNTHYPALSLASEVYLDGVLPFIDAVAVPTLRNGNTQFIPLSTLYTRYEVESIDEVLQLSPLLIAPVDGLNVNQQMIKNEKPYPVTATITDIFWDGTQCIDVTYTITLPPYASQVKSPPPEEQYYLSSFVTELNGLSTELSSSFINDLKDGTVYELAFNHYNRKQTIAPLFKGSEVIATLNYAIPPLKTNQEVILLWAERGKYYTVCDDNNKEYTVPWESLTIKGRNHYASGSVSKQVIEDYANINGFTSETPYYLWTDVSRNYTYILENKKGSWTLLKSFVCALGKDENPTPHGHFKVDYQVPYFGMEHNFQCKYGVVFFRDFMYHSVLFDKTGEYVIKSQLGTHASSGCIRLSPTDSKWLYDHIPIGTPVWIN